MNPRNYACVSGIVFVLIAILQFLRFILGWQVMAEGHVIPLWPSAVAALVAGFLAYWGLSVSKKS